VCPKVVEAMLRHRAASHPADGTSAVRLRVSSRLLGGGNPIWHHAGSWENEGLEGRSLHHGRPPDPELAAAAARLGCPLEGVSEALVREDLDEAHVVMTLGNDAPALLCAAADAWGGEELRNHTQTILYGIPTSDTPCISAWRRGAGSAAAEEMVAEAAELVERQLLPWLYGTAAHLAREGGGGSGVEGEGCDEGKAAAAVAAAAAAAGEGEGAGGKVSGEQGGGAGSK